MINIRKVICGELQENCYVVWRHSNDGAVIIDPGGNIEGIKNVLSQNNINKATVLLTHGHYDHIGACKQLQNNGFKVYIHEKDADKCEDNSLNLSNMFNGGTLSTFSPNNVIIGEDGELNINGLSIKYIHTPGHSEGSVCYVIENNIFTGDTLFIGGYGRTDFYDGSAQKLRNSVARILKYTNLGFKIFPGH